MAQSLFTIDGHTYNVGIVSLKRQAQILDGDNAGRVKSGGMVRDIIGTYYNYVLSISGNELSASAYDDLWERVTDPSVDYHTITVPYGATGSITFKAYITAADDELIKTKTISENSKNRWDKLNLTFTAMNPFRRP